MSRSSAPLGAAVVGALGAALALVAVPAHAAPEPLQEAPSATNAVFDPNLTGAYFINTTREAYCVPEVIAWEVAFTAWLEGGGQGPEPAFPEDAVTGAVSFTGHTIELPTGAIVFRAALKDAPVEVWQFDPEIVSPETLGVGPCLDTDQANTLLAAGTATWRANDNDRTGSGTRGNAWHDKIVADVSGVGGTWTYLANFHNVVPRGGDYRFIGGDRVIPAR